MYNKPVRNFASFAAANILIALGLITSLAAQENQFSLLAVSWQPSFCELRSNRPECRTQTATRYDGSHFSLHGLWPQPRSNQYCRVNERARKIDKKGRWGKLPDLKLSPELFSRLAQIMPGTRSYLHRHEWIKHGTCHENGSPQGYFEDALRLTNELNISAAQKLFSENIGGYLSTRQIRAAFDASFGQGAGKRIRVACAKDGNRRIIREITIGLFGVIDESASLGQLIRAAKPTNAGCKGGIVDAVGLQ